MPRPETFKAMGLTVLQPRFVFPTARPSPVAPAEPAVAKHAAVSGASEQAAVTAATGQNTQQKEQNGVVDLAWLRQQVGEAEEPVDSAERNSSGQALRFRLRLLRYGPLLMVVDQPMLQWQQEHDARAFFADIHYFLLDQDCQDCQDLTFNWPPSKHFPLAGDVECARQTLTGFISELPVQWVLLWGEQAAQYMLEQTADIGEVILADKYHLIQLQAPEYYWQQPASKKLLWQYLQAIRKQQPGQ